MLIKPKLPVELSVPVIVLPFRSRVIFFVLVIDVSWIEIYTKKDEDCLKFIRNAKCCKGRDIKIKTESNDGRYTFLIS